MCSPCPKPFSEDKPLVSHSASMVLKVNDRFIQHTRAASHTIFKKQILPNRYKKSAFMRARMAKSNRLYLLGLGNMLFAGCKADALNSSVFNFAHTQVLIDDLNKVVSSEIVHLDASCAAMVLNLNFSQIEAVFFEINTPDVTHESLDVLKKIRQANQTACVFILVTHSKSFSGTHFYVSGADHCLKLPNDPQERRKLLSKTFEASHWKSPTQLYLDHTRLLLCSGTYKLDISYTEMTIIDALMQAPEHVMNQDSIAKTLDPNVIFYDPRALEKSISRLRTKIKKAYNIELIISVRSYGYRLRRGTISEQPIYLDLMHSNKT